MCGIQAEMCFDKKYNVKKCKCFASILFDGMPVKCAHLHFVIRQTSSFFKTLQLESVTFSDKN